MRDHLHDGSEEVAAETRRVLLQYRGREGAETKAARRLVECALREYNGSDNTTIIVVALVASLTTDSGCVPFMWCAWSEVSTLFLDIESLIETRDSNRSFSVLEKEAKLAEQDFVCAIQEARIPFLLIE